MKVTEQTRRCSQRFMGGIRRLPIVHHLLVELRLLGLLVTGLHSTLAKHP